MVYYLGQLVCIIRQYYVYSGTQFNLYIITHQKYSILIIAIFIKSIIFMSMPTTNLDVNVDRLQLSLPRTLALLFAGSALYIGFIDYRVRQVHRQEKSQLSHWSVMYNSSKIPMTILSSASTLFGLNAYRLTKEPLWIYGSLAVFSIIPFTFLIIMGINKKLAILESSAKPGVETSQGVVSLLSGWLARHRVRALLALVAAGVFYVAEGKNTGVTVPKQVN